MATGGSNDSHGPAQVPFDPLLQPLGSLPVAVRQQIADSEDGLQRLSARMRHYEASKAPSTPLPPCDLESAIDISTRALSNFSTGWLQNEAWREYIRWNVQPPVNTNPGPGASNPEDTEEPENEFVAAWKIIQKGIEMAERGQATKQFYIEGPIADMESVNLHPHQREGLGRLEHLEKEHQGWILADEMGLGKTIQTVALLARGKLSGGIGPNLIVAPHSLLPQWKRELDHAPCLDVYNFWGKSKEPVDFDTFDVVLCTYDQVMLAHRAVLQREEDWRALAEGYRTGPKKPTKTHPATMRVLNAERISSPLLDQKWQRVILDEAHQIRNVQSKRNQAIMMLKADIRGCISGTPLQNDYSDFASLLAFLRFGPFADRNFFARCFIRKGKKGMAAEKLERRLELCLASVRRAICVRRRRGETFEGKPVTGVGPKTAGNVLVALDDEAQAIQNRWRLLWDVTAQEQRATDIANGIKVAPFEFDPGENLKAYTCMTMACCHSDIPDAKYGAPEDVRPGFPDVAGSGAADAEPMDEDAEPMDPGRRQAFIKQQSTGGRWMKPKIVEAVNLVKKWLAERELLASKATSPLEKRQIMAKGKIILFTPWLTAADIVGCGLKEAGIKFYELNGTRSDAERLEDIRNFEEEDENGMPKNFNNSEPDDTRVCIANVRVAGEGLNLVHACKVIHLSPIWNPFTSEQATARVHRIGQTEDVEVVTIHAIDSVEDRVRKIIDDKYKKVSGVVTDKFLDKDLIELQKLDDNAFYMAARAEQ